MRRYPNRMKQSESSAKPLWCERVTFRRGEKSGWIEPSNLKQAVGECLRVLIHMTVILGSCRWVRDQAILEWEMRRDKNAALRGDTGSAFRQRSGCCKQPSMPGPFWSLEFYSTMKFWPIFNWSVSYWQLAALSWSTGYQIGKFAQRFVDCTDGQ